MPEARSRAEQSADKPTRGGGKADHARTLVLVGLTLAVAGGAAWFWLRDAEGAAQTKEAKAAQTQADEVAKRLIEAEAKAPKPPEPPMPAVPGQGRRVREAK
jgi:hypothetical protein